MATARTSCRSAWVESRLKPGTSTPTDMESAADKFWRSRETPSLWLSRVASHSSEAAAASGASTPPAGKERWVKSHVMTAATTTRMMTAMWPVSRLVGDRYCWKARPRRERSHAQACPGRVSTVTMRAFIVRSSKNFHQPLEVRSAIETAAPAMSMPPMMSTNQWMPR